MLLNIFYFIFYRRQKGKEFLRSFGACLFNPPPPKKKSEMERERERRRSEVLEVSV